MITIYRALITIVIAIAFTPIVNAQHLRLSTPSDSAMYYYYEGWRQVMDVANYTQSELAYRKMMDHDPDFLVGLSLLGRITRDLNERKEIESRLGQKKSVIHGDERLLLDNYIGLVKLTNLSATDSAAAIIQMEKAFKASELNLRIIVHRYPDEIYYLAEYIEVLHHNHGPQRALDSLYSLARVQQQNVPFLLGYAANMEAEAGNFKNALLKAKLLTEKIEDKQSPKPHVVYGDIYYKMGNFEMAHDYIEIALKLDPGNIDAQRLEKKIAAQLKK